MIQGHRLTEQWPSPFVNIKRQNVAFSSRGEEPSVLFTRDPNILISKTSKPLIGYITDFVRIFKGAKSSIFVLNCLCLSYISSNGIIGQTQSTYFYFQI